MPTGRRPERVAESMREVLSELILREVKDPRVGMMTVTRVEVSPDLRHSRIYFSCVGDEAARERTIAGLNRASGFLRGQLTKELNLRYAPELRFIFDRSIDDVDKLAQVLRNIIPDDGTPDSDE